MQILSSPEVAGLQNSFERKIIKPLQAQTLTGVYLCGCFACGRSVHLPSTITVKQRYNLMEVLLACFAGPLPDSTTPTNHTAALTPQRPALTFPNQPIGDAVRTSRSEAEPHR